MTVKSRISPGSSPASAFDVPEAVASAVPGNFLTKLCELSKTAAARKSSIY